MERDYLQQFHEMEHHREAVRSFMLQTLDELALKDVYNRKSDTYGYPEARETIKRLFSRLEELYGEKDKPITSNKAR
jgi:hypothetical protein